MKAMEDFNAMCLYMSLTKIYYTDDSACGLQRVYKKFWDLSYDNYEVDCLQHSGRTLYLLDGCTRLLTHDDIFPPIFMAS
jgi:hypothetical protein